MPFDNGNSFCKTATLNCPSNNFHLINESYTNKFNETYSNKFNNSNSSNLFSATSKPNGYDPLTAIHSNPNNNFYNDGAYSKNHSLYSSILKNSAMPSGGGLQGGLPFNGGPQTTIGNNLDLSSVNGALPSHLINSPIKTNGYLGDKQSPIDEQQLNNLKKLNAARKSKEHNNKPMSFKHKHHHHKQPPLNQTLPDAGHHLHTPSAIELIQQTLDKDLNNNIGLVNGLNNSNGSNSGNSNSSGSLSSSDLTKSLTNGLVNNFVNHLTNNNLISNLNMNGNMNPNLSPGLNSNLSSSLNSLNNLNSLNSLNNLNSLSNLNSISSLDLADMTKHLNENIKGLLPGDAPLLNSPNYPLASLNQQMQLKQQLTGNCLGSPNSMDPMKSILSLTALAQRKLDPNKAKKFGKFFGQHRPGLPGDLDPSTESFFNEPIKKICRVCGDKGRSPFCDRLCL